MGKACCIIITHLHGLIAHEFMHLIFLLIINMVINCVDTNAPESANYF